MTADRSTIDLSLARRDVIMAAGAGLAGTLLAGATAQAQTATPAGGEFWMAEYTAKKGDVSLQMYRKRVGAPGTGAAKPVLFLVHGSSNGAQSSDHLQVPGKEYSMTGRLCPAGLRRLDHGPRGLRKILPHLRQFRYRQRRRGF